MEVILREDVEKLGSRGEVVKVASGYARNFLLPKRLAVAATESNKKIVEQEKQAHLRKEAKVEAEAQELAKLIGAVTVTISRKGRRKRSAVRFGDVQATSPMRWRSRATACERRKIPLDEPIRSLGEHKVPIRLHKDVTAEVTVVVVKEE